MAAVIPFLFLVGYLAYGEVSREQRRVQDEALARARGLAAQLERYVSARIEAVTGAATVLGGSGKDEAAIDAQARRLRQGFPEFERVTVVDELGVVVASVPSAGQRRPAVGDQEWFKRAATSTEPFVGGATPVGPDLQVGLYAPVRAPEGQMRGVIAAELSLRRVQELFGQTRLEGGAVAELVSDRATILARQPALYVGRDVRGLAGYVDLVRSQGGTGELTFEDGERRLTGAATVRPLGWTVVVGFVPGRMLADTRTRLGLIGAGAATIAILAVFAAVVVSRRQARGMERLRAAMGRLEAGDIPPNVPVAVGGDVGNLTEGFNRMLAWLHTKLREYEAISRVEEAAGAAATGDQSVEGVLPGLLRRVVGGMGADVGVLLIQEEGGLVTRASVGFQGITTEGVKFRRGQGLAGAVASGREAIVVPDVDSDYRVDEPYLKEAGIRSVVAVPVLTGDEVAGVVEVGYRMPHTFAEAEIQRLEAMARRTGQAIAHARALDAVRQNTVGLEAQVAEQLEALQQAATEKAEARRQVQEARRQTQEAEQRMRMQAAQAREVREVIVEKEVVRYDPAGEESVRLRAEMQKTVSEELRAPLTALLDLPRFLVEGLNKPLGKDQREQLEILRDRGEEILELIDSLVILSGLEAGQLKAAKAAFDLPTAIHRVVRALQPRAAAKGNRIEADIKVSVGQVVSDGKRLEQVLTNLLLTAIRYTEVGEIRVTCYLRDNDVVLTVADDGLGFTPEEQARIFQPFLQLGPRNGRAVPGTGLLLTVAKRLVDLLGGRIRVESEVDRGTWITVSLPGPT